MTENYAATLPIVTVPRLLLDSLRELRGLIDAQSVSSSPSPGINRPDGGDDGTTCTMATARSRGPRKKAQSSTSDWIRWFARRSRVCSNFFSTNAAPPPQRRRRRTMSKITPDHLSRSAYVYVRQSTPGQLINNPE